MHKFASLVISGSMPSSVIMQLCNHASSLDSVDPVADDPEHGGGRGLGGTPSLGRPRERCPLFGDVYVLHDVLVLI